MAKLIKNDVVTSDNWTVLTLAAGETPETAKIPHGDVLVPLSVWRARKWDLVQRQWHGVEGNRVGVWLAPQDDPANVYASIAMNRPRNQAPLVPLSAGQPVKSPIAFGAQPLAASPLRYPGI